ncbi:MAG: His/Gly/Thr/Pro-type tRNA ligase C-terminal domain-containing protein, partial [Candidatus Zixiibacteriota bacterium]
FIAALGDEAKAFAVKLVRDLRQKNISCETDYLQRSLKAQLREANRQKAEKVLIIGEEEMKKGRAVLKDMQSGEQKEIDLDQIGDTL